MYVYVFQKSIMALLDIQGLNNVNGLIIGAINLFHNFMIVI